MYIPLDFIAESSCVCKPTMKLDMSSMEAGRSLCNNATFDWMVHTMLVEMSNLRDQIETMKTETNEKQDLIRRLDEENHESSKVIEKLKKNMEILTKDKEDQKSDQRDKEDLKEEIEKLNKVIRYEK